jgi:hypothetical protein
VTTEHWITIAQIVGGLLTAGGLAAGGRAVIRAIRRPVQATAHVELNAATLEWAKKLEASADRAWARANEAEAKAEQANDRAEQADLRADKAEQTARRAQAQINEISRWTTWMLRMIADPGMTMEHLREAVGEGPPHIT